MSSSSFLFSLRHSHWHRNLQEGRANGMYHGRLEGTWLTEWDLWLADKIQYCPFIGHLRGQCTHDVSAELVLGNSRPRSLRCLMSGQLTPVPPPHPGVTPADITLPPRAPGGWWPASAIGWGPPWSPGVHWPGPNYQTPPSSTRRQAARSGAPNNNWRLWCQLWPFLERFKYCVYIFYFEKNKRGNRTCLLVYYVSFEGENLYMGVKRVKMQDTHFTFIAYIAYIFDKW